MPVLNLRVGNIGAPHHYGLRVLGIGRLIAFPHLQTHQRADVQAGNRLHAVITAHIEASADAASIHKRGKSAVRARDRARLIA